jgi:PAS domain S-box-containing protein
VVDDVAGALVRLFPRLSVERAAHLAAVMAAERVVVAPILARGHVSGHLAVWGRRARLAEDDASVVAALAAQVGIALENRRLFREVEAERARWRATLDGIADLVITCDAGGRITYINPAYARLLGRLVALDVPTTDETARYDMRHPDGRLFTVEELPLQRALAAGQPVAGVEITLPCPAGDRRYTVWAGSPIRGEGGEPVGAVAIGRDVTDAHRLERQNRAALQVLLRIAARVTDPEMRADPAALLPAISADLARMESVDHAHTMLVGEDGRLTPLAFSGLAPEQEASWRDLVGRVDLAAVPGSDRLLASLSAGELFVQDFARDEPFVSPPIARALGVRAGITAPILIGGRLVGVITIGRTRPNDPGRDTPFAPWDRELLAGVARLVGEALDRSRLDQQLGAAHAARLVAEEAARVRDEFLSIASHELKTPLTSLKTYTQSAARRAGRALAERGDEIALSEAMGGLRGTLDRINLQVNRLTVLVNDLVDTARIESGHLQLHPARCDLAALCRENAEEQGQATNRSIGVTAPTDPVLVVADPDRIHQVVANLLSNALKYSAEDRPVALAVTVTDGRATVAVRDEGPGIPPEEHAGVFERFHRVPGVEVVSGSGVGLGLGLFISQEIIARHGGRIWVESRSGQGATFCFSLPQAPDPAP